MARRSKTTVLNAEVVRRLGEAWAAGATDRIAAGYAGVGLSTLAAWIARAKAGQEEYRCVLEARDVHTSAAALTALRVVGAAAEEGQWQAAAWLLERRFGYTRPPHVVEVETRRPEDIAARAADAIERLGLTDEEG